MSQYRNNFHSPTTLNTKTTTSSPLSEAAEEAALLDRRSNEYSTFPPMQADNTAPVAPSRIGGGTVLAFLLSVNLVNFIDRGIVAGAPIQFGAFISRTLHVRIDEQQAWMGSLFSAFVACYSIAAVVFGHLLHSVPQFRLLSVGLSIWVGSLAVSGLCYWGGDTPLTFWLFLLARAVSGVGEAAFQTIVPPYIEDFAPPGSRGLWLALYYIAIPTGTAIGFGYGALLAPAPPESTGWGAAYLFEALAMLPCVVLVRWLPSASAIVALRDATGERRARGPLLEPFRSNSSAPMASAPEPAAGEREGEREGARSGAEPDPDGTVVCATHAELPADLSRSFGRELSPVDPDAASAPATESLTRLPTVRPTVGFQLRVLLTSADYVLLALGYAAYTATLMGIAAFGSLLLLALQLYSSQTTASLRFSMAVAIGGVVGTPLGGYISDTFARRARLAAESSMQAPSGFADAEAAKSRRLALVEARSLVGTINVMIATAVVLMVACVCTLYSGPDSREAFLFLMCLGVTAAFGTSAGVSRSVMLLVTSSMRSFALACLTLILHALGDVPSPPIIGMLAGSWAPHCAIIYVNRTATSHGTPVLDPRCFAGRAAGEVYSAEQRGLIGVMLFAVLYMGTACLYWGGCYVLLSIRARKATEEGRSSAHAHGA